jgi:hypothetical protein
MKVYMVKIIAESHLLNWQRICCRFSTCLQLWQTRVDGCSQNPLTCTMPWIRPTRPTEEFRTPLRRNDYRIKKPQAMVPEEKDQGVEYLRHNNGQVVIEDTQLCLGKSILAVAFLPKMAHQTIHRHSGGAKTLEYVPQTDSDHRHLIRCHPCVECFQRYSVSMMELNILISTMCHSDMYIHLLRMQTLTLSIIMYIWKIASTIQSLIQIC